MTGFAKLRNAMAQSGQIAAGLYEPGAKGIVTSYDPKAYAVKLKIQPSDTETGWLPIKALQAGADFGIFAAPNLGDQGVIEFENGDAQVGMVTGFVPSKQDRPPEVAAGEILIKHKSGSFLRFNADGTITSKGAWEHDGELKVKGDIIDRSATNAVTLYTLRTKYNAHFHLGVTTGAGVSGGTNQPAT